MKLKTTVLAFITMALMLFASPMVSADNSTTYDEDRSVFAIAAGATAIAIDSGIAPVAAAVYMIGNGDTYANDCPKTLYNAPGYAVDKGGYTVHVTACDYEINKERLSRYDARRLK